MNICKNCGAKILWKQTNKGANISVELESVDPFDCEDTDTLLRDDGVIRRVTEIVGDHDYWNYEWYLTHRSVCARAK